MGDWRGPFMDLLGFPPRSKVQPAQGDGGLGLLPDVIEFAAQGSHLAGIGEVRE